MIALHEQPSILRPSNHPDRDIPPGTFYAGNPEQASTGIRVERLTPADIPAYRAIMHEAIQNLPYLTEENRQDQLNVRTPAYYEALLADPIYNLIVAKDHAGKVVGGMETRFYLKNDATKPTGIARLGYVVWIATDKEERGKGIGLKMYQGFEDMMRARGDVDTLDAHVHDDNTASLELHKRMGITTVTQRNKANTGAFYSKKLTP